MAERDELGGALGGLNAGEAGGVEDVALGDFVAADGEGKRLGDVYECFGGGGAGCHRFGADVDHLGAAGFVDVGEFS